MKKSSCALQSKLEEETQRFLEHQDKASTMLEQDSHGLLSLPSTLSNRASCCARVADEETEAQ